MFARREHKGSRLVKLRTLAQGFSLSSVEEDGSSLADVLNIEPWNLFGVPEQIKRQLNCTEALFAFSEYIDDREHFISLSFDGRYLSLLVHR